MGGRIGFICNEGADVEVLYWWVKGGFFFLSFTQPIPRPPDRFDTLETKMLAHLQ